MTGPLLVVIGAALIVLAVILLFRRPAPQATPTPDLQAVVDVLTADKARLQAELFQQQRQQPTVDPVALYRAIESLPAKVLQTINGSINPQQGKVAELLAYAELRQDYDQIVPLGKPVDFIGFRFAGPEPVVEFVEVKSGKSQLTPDEVAIKRSVDTGAVRFRVVRVTDEAKKLLGGQDA